MIVTLTGENDFVRTSELGSLVASFIDEHGDLALERLDGEETEFARISEALTGLPFLASKKLIVFKNPSASKDFLEKFEPLLKNLPETTDLAMVEPKLDKRTSLYKYLKKASDYHEFNKLDAHSLASWLVKQAGALGGDLSLADARYLVERAGENQQKLASELEKLILYAAKIDRESIDKLVAPTPQSKVFDLLDAAFAGNAQKAQIIYDEQRALKVEPQEIMGTLAWQLHLLALVKTGAGKSASQIASEAKASPYPIEKSQRLARNLELKQIRSMVRGLLELDEQIKTSSIDVDEALRTYFLELAIRSR